MTRQTEQAALQGMPWSGDAIWWVVLIEAALAIGLGLYLVVAPGPAATLITRLLGLYVLIMGALAIHRGLQESVGREAGFQLMRGAVGVTVGLLTFLPTLFFDFEDNPTAISSLLFILATGLTLQGLIGLWGVIDLRECGVRGVVVLGSLLRLLVGLLLFFQLITGADFALVIGLAAIIVGSVLLLVSLILRYSQSESESEA